MRATVDPAQVAGWPRIRGRHIPVATIVAAVDVSTTHEVILEALPDLEGDDVAETLRCAAGILAVEKLAMRRAL